MTLDINDAPDYFKAVVVRPEEVAKIDPLGKKIDVLCDGLSQATVAVAIGHLIGQRVNDEDTFCKFLDALAHMAALAFAAKQSLGDGETRQ